jgi:hypothetical protein
VAVRGKTATIERKQQNACAKSIEGIEISLYNNSINFCKPEKQSLPCFASKKILAEKAGEHEIKED